MVSSSVRGVYKRSKCIGRPGTDACAVPVLTPEEAAALDASSSPFPVPHPRIASSASPPTRAPGPGSLALEVGKHTREVLKELGINDIQIEEMVRDGAVSTGTERLSKL
jgi:alpha-methylacyl-CoA racemase